MKNYLCNASSQVGQTFLSAGKGGFPAARLQPPSAFTGLESPVNRQAGKPALRQNAGGGFTLIELMIVVAVIGILAAVVVTNVGTTTYDAKVSAVKGHIAVYESALERFNVNMDRYPTTEEGLKVLVEAPAGEEKKWRGPYIKMVRNDPWGHAYQYRFPGAHHTSSFDLWSRGADGADGGEGNNADIGNWQ